MTTCDRIDAALLELADVRTELHVARVDRLHRLVGLVARLDGRAGVLMQRGDQTDVGDRLAQLVERGDDVLLVARCSCSSDRPRGRSVR